MLTRAKRARVAAAAFLLLLVFVAFLGSHLGSSQHRETPQNERPSAQSDKKSAEDSELYRFWKWATYDAITVYNLFLALFTGALVIVSNIQIRYLRRADKTARITADGAKSSAETARQALIVSNRAWVRVTVSVGDMPLRFNEQGAQFAIKIQVTNTGEAPALRVTHTAWLVAHKSGVQPLQRQQELCEGLRGRGAGFVTTLFPDEIFPQNLGVGGMNLGANASRAEIDEGLVFDIPERRRVQLFVIVCTNYTYPTDPDGCHQTRYLFDVRMRDWKAPDVTRGTILPSELMLMEGMGGAGRYAD